MTERYVELSNYFLVFLLLGVTERAECAVPIDIVTLASAPPAEAKHLWTEIVPDMAPLIGSNSYGRQKSGVGMPRLPEDVRPPGYVRPGSFSNSIAPFVLPS